MNYWYSIAPNMLVKFENCLKSTGKDIVDTFFQLLKLQYIYSLSKQIFFQSFNFNNIFQSLKGLMKFSLTISFLSLTKTLTRNCIPQPKNIFFTSLSTEINVLNVELHVPIHDHLVPKSQPTKLWIFGFNNR